TTGMCEFGDSGLENGSGKALTGESDYPGWPGARLATERRNGSVLPQHTKSAETARPGTQKSRMMNRANIRSDIYIPAGLRKKKRGGT
ncbi:hypothetical protein, partial [Robiginitalea biformata]|uniref:hypothetical protein n=1 Tax=Robiginitalea biformata TaxID=252307 RepID=UPI003D324DC6